MISRKTKYILLYLFLLFLFGFFFSARYIFASDTGGGGGTACSECGSDPKCYCLSEELVDHPAHYKGLVPCGKCVCTSYFDNNGKCVDMKTFKATNIDRAEGCATSGQASTSCIYVPCNFCHFFIMFNGIVKFVLVYIVPPIAALVLMIGGIMFYFAGGNTNLVAKAKGLIMNAIIGLALVYGAYLIVGAILSALGVASWTTLGDWANTGAFTINCKVPLPPGHLPPP